MLKFKVIHNLSKTTPCQVILVNKDKQIIAIDKLATQQARIEKLLTLSHFGGDVADVLMDFDCEDNKQQNHLLLVGIGQIEKLTANSLQKIAQVIYKTLHQHQQTAQIILHDVFNQQQFAQFVLALLNQSYRFDVYQSEKKDNSLLETIQLLIKDKTWKTIVQFQTAVFIGQSLTKDLANQPPNVCYPAYLAEQAKTLAKTYSELLTVKVIGEKEMQKLGMNCFLAVSHGSEREGQLILLEYNGTQTGKKTKKPLTNPLVFVGKGVTFDTGGISLKPAANMGEMKYDMSGAASVLGMIKALCEAKLPLQVVGALACAENMPSGRATRPGDIVTAMNGKTVEILNTDAEGRLVLADTLTYVHRYQPKVIIDMATLTGACIVALGYIRSAVYSHDNKLLADLQKASDDAFDRIWHMPLDDDYHEQLSSNMADIQNIGGMPAGSVTAACFLSKFVEKDIPWAHLDIAGTAWKSGKEPSSTGRPVPLLMNYLKQQAEQNH